MVIPFDRRIAVDVGNLARLLSLGAIWGASFLFMRVLSPVLGPYATADARLLIAGLALTLVARGRGQPLEWRRLARVHLSVGVLQAGLPFLLYCWAALVLPASYSAVLNATAPTFAMLVAAAFGEQRPGPVQLTGGALGMTGVAILTGFGPVTVTGSVLLAVAACLTAALCYALAGHIVRRDAPTVPPLVLSAGSHLAAGVMLLGPALALPGPGPITPRVVAMALALALLCSALAFVLYFRLIQDLGATRALTVTYLIPLFGLLWARLFLGEPLTAGMAIGGALVLLGTVMVLRR
jgi:drug/metabolite transporter (DMT)-like permease